MRDVITITGNIATDPQQRVVGRNGDPVTSFRVASSTRVYDRGAERWTDGHTNWFRVSVWRGLGDNAFRSLRKGDRVIVSGRLKVSDWEAEDGKQGTSIEIEADAIGHDLLWGTTTFQKSARPADTDRSAGSADSDEEPGASRDSGTQWATIGTPADTADATTQGQQREADAAVTPF